MLNNINLLKNSNTPLQYLFYFLIMCNNYCFQPPLEIGMNGRGSVYGEPQMWPQYQVGTFDICTCTVFKHFYTTVDLCFFCTSAIFNVYSVFKQRVNWLACSTEDGLH